MTVFVVLGLLAVWFFIALVCVGLCVSAAQGDRGLTPRLAQLPEARRFKRGSGSAA